MSENRFWETKQLAELSSEEWEAVCDGCGRCCLQKLQNDYTEEIHYTKLACKLLDLESCKCQDYSNRLERVPDCVQITVERFDEFFWLPKTCGYRLLGEGKALFDWHPLISGSPESVVEAGISVRGKAVPEANVPEHKWENHIIRWVEV